MDVSLYRDTLAKRIPEFNKELVQGLAYAHLRPKPTMEYLDRIIQSVVTSYNNGLDYLGSRRCTPLEEYQVSIGSTKKGRFDVANSSLYMVRYDFSYLGQPCKPQYLYLPFAGPGGLYHMSDKRFGISPILADRFFSITGEEIHIPMPRAKLNVYRDLQTIVCDGKRLTRYVTWSWLHNRGGKIVRGTNVPTLIRPNEVKSTAMHYLFCKYGFTATFERYLGITPVVLEEKDYLTKREEYPTEEWILYKSIRERPKAYIPDDYHLNHSTTCVLIPRAQWRDLVDLFIAGFYYIVDRLPSQMDADTVDDLEQWQTMMGYVISGDFSPRGKATATTQDHIASIDGYVDFQVKENIAFTVAEQPASEERLNQIDNIYDLLVYVIDRQSLFLIEGNIRPNNLYTKQFVVLRYVLSNITSKLFELLFKLTSPRTEIRDIEDMNRMLSAHFKLKEIFGLNSSYKGQRHAEVSSVNSSSDNMLFKITSVMIHQSDANGSRSGGRDEIDINNPINHLDSSYAEVAGYTISPKSAPIGNSRINPWVLTNPDGTIRRKEKFRELTDGVKDMITRK